MRILALNPHSRAARALPLFALTFALSSCAVGPDFFEPKARVDHNWLEKGDSRVSNKEMPSDWWRTFRDPTLDRLVSAAAAQNLTVQIAGLRILEARAQLGVAIGALYPQQQAGVGAATWNTVSEKAANTSELPSHSFPDYVVGFDASWELDFWGRFRRNVEASEGQMAATIADYDNALVVLTAEVARTYVTLRTYETLLVIARENVKIQQDGLNIANARLQNGASSELDVVQQRSLLENTLASIPQLQTGAQRAKNALSVLLGEPPGGVDSLLRGTGRIPSSSARVNAGLPAELLRRRPDIRAAEMLAAAECARIGVAESEIYPHFYLFGNVGTEAVNPSELFSPQSAVLAVGPTFNWAILNYGRLADNVRYQDAKFQEAVVHYKDVVLKAQSEVEDAMVGFLKSQQRAANLENSVQAADRAVQIAFVQYREGSQDYQRVLDTQSSLLDERNQLAQTRSDISTNLIALNKALGGGWEIRNGKPAIPPSMQEEMMARTDWGNLLPQEPPPPAAVLPLPTPAGQGPFFHWPDAPAFPLPFGRPSTQ